MSNQSHWITEGIAKSSKRKQRLPKMKRQVKLIKPI